MEQSKIVSFDENVGNWRANIRAAVLSTHSKKNIHLQTNESLISINLIFTEVIGQRLTTEKRAYRAGTEVRNSAKWLRLLKGTQYGVPSIWGLGSGLVSQVPCLGNSLGLVEIK